MREPVTIRLSSPVTVIDREISEIALRPPTGKDLIATGNPMAINLDGGPGGINFDTKVMAAMIARLGNLTVTAVEDMAAEDFMAAALAVMVFLAPSAT